jgi:hypothetical protein
MSSNETGFWSDMFAREVDRPFSGPKSAKAVGEMNEKAEADVGAAQERSVAVFPSGAEGVAEGTVLARLYPIWKGPIEAAACQISPTPSISMP